MSTMQTVHENSKASYFQDLDRLQGREAAILHFIKSAMQPMTDREIAAEMGFGHRSEVQPRITELIKAGKVRNAYSAPCPITGKPVRHVSVCLTDETGQGRLFL